jgi:hypothetical protein
LGTEEHPERRPAFPWIPRFSSFLSILSVTLISIDILRDKKKAGNVYCRLMLGMSVFDFFSSFAWIASSAAIPYDAGEPIYGASGNEATCKAQCFFFQLSIGGIFYNVSLSTYYYMVIIMSKREKWLKAQEWWLHGIPIGIGLIISFASIPFASNNYYGCHVRLSPKEFDWISYGLYVFPVGFVLIYCTSVTVFLCWSVRRQSSIANKWSFPLRETLSQSKITSEITTGLSRSQNKCKKRNTVVFHKLKNQVMWQSVLYLSAFWCTWPLFLIAFVASDAVASLPQSVEYVYFVVALTFAPLQGFFNAIFYFRSRLGQILCNRKKVQSKTPDTPRSRFVSSILTSSYWSQKMTFLSWTFFKLRKNTTSSSQHGINHCHMNQSSSFTAMSNTKRKDESDIQLDPLHGCHDTSPFESSIQLPDTSNTNMDAGIWNSNSHLEEDICLDESKDIQDGKMYSDPSILLDALSPMDESEHAMFMDISQVPSNDANKEIFS